MTKRLNTGIIKVYKCKRCVKHTKIERKKDMSSFNKVLDDFVDNIDIKRSEYTDSLVPNSGICLGLKIDDVRQYAKKNLNLFHEIIDYPDNIYYEIDLLKIQVVLLNKELELKDKIALIDSISYTIKNWSICDTLGIGIKVKKSDMRFLFDYALSLITSEKEFRCRLGVIILQSKFVSEEYLDEIFAVIPKIELGKYYIDMAVAWLIQTAYVKMPEKTFEFLNEIQLTEFVVNKTVSKISDSKRVSRSDKNKIKAWKKSYLNQRK